MTLSDCIGKGKIFEGAILINLPSRVDRLVHSRTQLSKVGALDSVEIMPAIYHRYGMVGCSLSHLECVKKAKERGWKSVLIFEDDIVFTDKFEECLEQTIKQLEVRDKWAVFHFGAMLMNLCKQVSPNLLSIGYNWAAHAVAIHERAYDFIIDNYDWSYSETDTSKPWGGHYPFDGFVNKNTFDKGFEIYSAYPVLITQLPNFSDTWGYHRDYKDLIEQSYDKQISREVNVLILSKNRPTQLHSTLDSYKKYGRLNDFAKITILYKADEQYKAAYQKLKEIHTSGKPWEIEFREEKDFLTDVKDILMTRPFVCFLVDDTIFHRPFSLGDGVSELCSTPDIFSFSLRLGLNTQYSYINNIHFPTPVEYTQTNKPIVRVDWHKENPYIDFGYPFEISSSIYRTDDVLRIFDLAKVGLEAPNYMELTGTTAVRNAKSLFGNKIATYRKSVAVSVPLNRVQNLHLNRCVDDPNYSPESLLKSFENGMMLNFDSINERWSSNSVHVELKPGFKPR